MLFRGMVIEAETLFFEHSPFQRANKAFIFGILVFLSLFISESGESIDNDTENDIHPNNNNDQEER